MTIIRILSTHKFKLNYKQSEDEEEEVKIHYFTEFIVHTIFFLHRYFFKKKKNENVFIFSINGY